MPIANESYHEGRKWRSDFIASGLLEETIPRVFPNKFRRIGEHDFDTIAVAEILFDILNELRGLRRDLKMARLKDGKPIL